MFEIIDIPTFSDDRGSLSVLESVMPFAIERVYYIYGVQGQRGGHRHIETRQAMVCVHGSVDVYMNNGKESKTITLSNPGQLLIVEPEDWHTMDNFSESAVLLLLASKTYNPDDYISEPYE